MSDRTLVLRLDSPMQSWGVGAKGTVKTTQSEPSFSGVIGLIANALGRKRTDDLSDLVSLEFGTRTDRSGHLMRDFFTAGTTTGVAVRKEETEGAKRIFRDTVDPNGIVGTKNYLTGAVFTVALRGEQSLVEMVAEALERPARTLYLGRKSCPLTRPPVDAVVHLGIEETLRHYPLDPALAPVPGSQNRNLPDLADPYMRLVLPALPTHPGAVQRFDVPTSFASVHRHYLSRYVSIDYIDRDEMLSHQGVAP